MVACAPWGAAGEFAASRHGVLTRSQAAEKGIDKHVVARLLRDETLVEIVPGVLAIHGAPVTWHQRVYAATLTSGGRGVAGFRSAAALGHMDGYSPGPIELLLPSGRRKHVQGVLHHRGPMGPEHAGDFVEIDGIPCTGTARTLCDLGSVDPPQRVKLAFESAWRDGCSLTWLRLTAERLHRPGQRGTGVLLRLLDEADRGGRSTESALEVEVEQALSGLGGLVRQFNVHDSQGRFVGRVDFAIPELKIAIEAHSRRFHFGADRQEGDAKREAALQAEGWIVRYITRSQTRNKRALRRSIDSLVAARKPR